MKTIFFVFLLIFVHLQMKGQAVTGHVLDTEGKHLPGATVRWEKDNKGALTDDEGAFTLPEPTINPQNLICIFPQYLTDTLRWEGQDHVDFELERNVQMEGITIEEGATGAHIDRINPVKTEVINEAELEKAACCDLGGCFETQTTVEPTTTNVITNAKELRILGLSGVYNQILMDGFPTFMGLNYTYGISSVPGPLVKTIYVAKGANSVLQGYEGMVGQINVIMKEPREADKFYLNGYMNSFLEKQANAHYAISREKWSTLIGGHVVTPAKKIDRDGDQFLDLPRITRYHFFNKWTYGDPLKNGLFGLAGIRYLNESRTGGQVNFNPEIHTGDTVAYGQSNKVSRPEIYTKLGYRFDAKNTVTGFFAASTHQQEAWFGALRYTATQKQIYGNLQYERKYGERNDLKTGVSLRVFDLNEDIAFFNDPIGRTYGGNYLKQEFIPGVFAENNLRMLDGKITWIAGARLDHHNTFGTQFTPRTLLKADIGTNGAIRGSVGWGWRTVNLWSENITLLASSRDVIITEQLKPETALNYGLNYTHNLEFPGVEMTLGVDLYRTQFSNQVFPDYYTAGIATISNFGGESVSNGFQAEATATIREVINLRAGYSYLDVYRTINGEKSLLPFNSKHRVNGSFSINPANRKWHLDGNAHWYGPMRMAATADLVNNVAAFSKGYTLFNGQFTWNFTRLELYAGCENIFDFRQLRPIVGYQQPFGPEFDTANVWGPTRGREIYLGFRYAIPQ